MLGCEGLARKVIKWVNIKYILVCWMGNLTFNFGTIHPECHQYIPGSKVEVDSSSVWP